jgi:hypothetical protein
MTPRPVQFFIDETIVNLTPLRHGLEHRARALEDCLTRTPRRA